MMNLQDLIQVLKTVEVAGATDKEISGIQSDSRRVEAGHLFVAVRGTAVRENQKTVRVCRTSR